MNQIGVRRLVVSKGRLNFINGKFEMSFSYILQVGNGGSISAIMINFETVGL